MTTIEINDTLGERRIAPLDFKACLIARGRDLIDSITADGLAGIYVPINDKRRKELIAIKHIFQANNISINFEV